MKDFSLFGYFLESIAGLYEAPVPEPTLVEQLLELAYEHAIPAAGVTLTLAGVGLGVYYAYNHCRKEPVALPVPVAPEPVGVDPSARQVMDLVLGGLREKLKRSKISDDRISALGNNFAALEFVAGLNKIQLDEFKKWNIQEVQEFAALTENEIKALAGKNDQQKVNYLHRDRQLSM